MPFDETKQSSGNLHIKNAEVTHDMTLENYIVKELPYLPKNGLTGRRKILTTANEITIDNVREVLEEALAVHSANAREITYLWNYYRGCQDIRGKKKYVREKINNKVTINRANEIVTFKTSFLLNEPIFYVSNGGDKEVSNNVGTLNEFMRAEDKESKDKETVDWMHISGVAERFVLTDKMANVEDGAPFYIYTLDPREAFVIYSAKIGQKPMAGVILQLDEQKQWFATVYTEDTVFTVTRDSVEAEGHVLGGIPLIEYVNNMARMGAFEPVLSILNGINQLESNALDSIEDFVNGFDVFQNCDIADGDYADLSIGGKAVKIKTVTQGMEAKVYRVVSELSQSGVQQRVDDMTEDYLTICGMPNRNGGSSTSDTGQAVIFRDGWSEAESRAKDTEKLFVRSERQFLRIVLNICNAKRDVNLNLELKDIGINFSRKSLNNLQSRFQCFMEGIGSDRVHPLCVFQAFGDIFGDKEAAYQMSMAWRDEQERKQEETLQAELDRERERIAANGNGEPVQASRSMPVSVDSSGNEADERSEA